MALRDWSHAEVGTVARVRHDDGECDVVMADGAVRACNFSYERRRYPYPLTKGIVIPAGEGQWWCAGSIEACPMVVHHEDFTNVPTVTSAQADFHVGVTWEFDASGGGGFIRQAASPPVGAAGAVEVSAPRLTVFNLNRPARVVAPEVWWVHPGEAYHLRWKVNIVALPADAGAFVVMGIVDLGSGAQGLWSVEGQQTNWRLANTSLTIIDATGHPIVPGEWVELEMVVSETEYCCGWIDGDGPFYVQLQVVPPPDYSAAYTMGCSGGQSLNPATTQAMWDYSQCTRLASVADEQTARAVAINTPEGSERVAA